ncbi:hypothetical protein BJ546DRAFT_95749 [Cryomyces antarcticus]
MSHEKLFTVLLVLVAIYSSASVYHLSSWAFVACFASVYLVCIQWLRFERVSRMRTEYPYKSRASLKKMTTDEAFKIQLCLMELEFPFTTEKALQFALFRTYGIPSISKLLIQTKQLSEKAFASKRYADTEVLIAEFIGHAPSSDRACSAKARMNYIHSVYQKAGKISNDDMLYTLSLFATEPAGWIHRYEWRDLTDMERCAFGVFWKSIGDAMEIDYSVLPSSKSGWMDGLQWFDEILAWSRNYEEKYMVPDLYNKKTADETTAILLYSVPEALKPLGRNFVSALMDERLRAAMIYPAPSQIYTSTINAIFGIRKFVLRHLMLPRPYFMRHQSISPTPDKDTGRYHRLLYASEPWYVKPTVKNRWALSALTDRIAGRPLPGDDGKKFKPYGYKINDVGPTSMEGKGMQAFEEVRGRLMKQGRGGCPFAFSE